MPSAAPTHLEHHSIGLTIITGGTGSNVVHADDYPQLIVLGEDDDPFNGGGGNDTIGSTSEDDLLIGGESHDWIFGGEGDDHLRGGTHEDTLRGGGRGKDWLKGGQGDDKLGGNPGRDILQGEQRADRFKLAAGRDLITDYNPSRGDKLILPEDLKLTTTKTSNITLADKSMRFMRPFSTSLETIIKNEHGLV